MNGNTRRVWWIAVAMLLVMGVVAVTPLSGSAGGNSANAKLCQKGKWAGLQGNDGTPFASEEDCVSYGAKGGRIVPIPTPTPTPTPTPISASIDILFAPTDDPDLCAVIAILTDFHSLTAYAVGLDRKFPNSDPSPFRGVRITTNADGDAQANFGFVTRNDLNPGVQYQVLTHYSSSQQLQSAWKLAEC